MTPLTLLTLPRGRAPRLLMCGLALTLCSAPIAGERQGAGELHALAQDIALSAVCALADENGRSAGERLEAAQAAYAERLRRAARDLSLQVGSPAEASARISLVDPAAKASRSREPVVSAAAAYQRPTAPAGASPAPKRNPRILSAGQDSTSPCT